MTIGEIIDSLIEDYDITMIELADILGCSTKQINRWKNNKAEMGIYKLKTMCEYFGVSADYILNLPQNLKKTREEILKEVKQ